MVWLLALIALVVGGLHARNSWRGWSTVRRLVSAAAGGVLVALIGASRPTTTLLVKTVTALVLPAGLLWLLLLVALFWAWGRARAARWPLIALLAFYTVAANPLVATLLTHWVEGEYRGRSPYGRGPFEAVIVLGGGSTTWPNDEQGVSLAGDRVVLGARLFHRGETDYLITTGRRIEELGGNRLDPSLETTRIWTGLGIPENRILAIGGRTTSEEADALKTLLEERSWKRIGLVTSAWHMRRARRLLERASIDAVPLPADSLTGQIGWSALELIPSANAFLDTNIALKEFLGYAAGR